VFILMTEKEILINRRAIFDLAKRRSYIKLQENRQFIERMN